MKLQPQEIEKIVWDEKYRNSPDEKTVEDTNRRVCGGVYKNDMDGPHINAALDAMNNREWCPAGRIHAGAGTNKKVTLINCYVSPTIEDSIVTESARANTLGIMQSLEVASLTQQMGGGIGMDFSTLRPRGALVRQRQTAASGPITFMDMWNSMCGTIMAAGNRRGAMMATLSCDHPDILEFIEAKHTPGRLTNFNVSVLVSEKFMDAVRNDEEWHLKFNVPRLDLKHEGAEYNASDDEKLYIYKRLPAKELWEKITRSTYDYAEPGVIFIDRINEWNNLWYCEDINCTNPCGEQSLPPNGACNLGAINLAVMVNKPFTPMSTIKLKRIGEIATLAMRFLDNVLDETYYPTPEQRIEAMNKRRTGLGITGLGNMLQQLGLRYGSEGAIETTRTVMKTIRDCAYLASVSLAKERGSFPLFDRDKFMKGKFIQTLPIEIRGEIHSNGIRNGVLLTIAPTGTTSIYYGNVSSGLEPTFAWTYKRKMRQADGSFKEFEQVEDYGFRLYKACHEIGLAGDDEKAVIKEMPNSMVTTQDLIVHNHLVMQAVCQEYVDASISKTINCPKDMTFKEFQDVYSTAYAIGLKGCTTYRPSEISEKVRGSILSVDEPSNNIIAKIVDRPYELPGTTYKIKWQPSGHAFYITVNDYVDNGVLRPFELFINTKDATHQEWIMALTRSISAIFRRGGDVGFIVKELQEVHSSVGGAWVGKKYVPSLVSLIGSVLEEHLRKTGYMSQEKETAIIDILELCPRCQAPGLVYKEGCSTCMSCGFSDCG